ncbi:Ger(x)C family spore germination protein [Paenibacillus herberti]|uniref:Spore gernimation protein GerC n=1 Tax=Paenibacillus herberti TaxID=1619309 RepID=A0A229NUS5_9BACL|nr:Ger(x)C family spore germination protein [Paenibacillus herberti]OXM13663.1 spore gernimation protein GerC [Paenibacillus herberti]
MLRKTALVLACLLMLSGCWSRRELNDLLIVLGIGIDWADGEYLVSYQVVNPNEISNKSSTNSRAPGTLFQGRGNTVFEAARSLTARSPRLMYLGHLQMLVVSEEVARRGISGAVDNPLRDHEVRMDYNVVLARGARAEDLLKLYTPLEKLPTYSMQQSLKVSEKAWAPTVAINMDRMLNMLESDGQQLVLTGIEIVGDREKADKRSNLDGFEPASFYRYRGIGAFKGNRLIGWLNEKESKGYSDLTDILGSTSIEVPCENGHYTGVEVTSSNTQITPEMKNGNITFLVKIHSSGDVVENSCKSLNLIDPATFPMLEEKTASVIKDNAMAVVKWSRSHQTDILGFGSLLEKKYPAYWKKAKEEWEQGGFLDSQIKYTIEMKINTTGTIGNSVSPKMN